MFVSKMTLNQSSLFGQVDDLQDLTFIERPIRRSLKTAEEIEKLTVDEDLNDIERAVYLLSSGQDVQRASVIINLPNLVRQNPAETFRRVVPKVREVLHVAGADMQLAAAGSFLTLLQDDIVLIQTHTHSILQIVLLNLDHRDTVVSNAWLETLLSAIDALPKETIRQEILSPLVSKAQLSQSLQARLASCRILGKVACKFESPIVKKDLLPLVRSLCQDVEYEVRSCMCRQLENIARGIGLDHTKAAVLPELVELARDEGSTVRLAAFDTIINLLEMFDSDDRTRVIFPLVKTFCEKCFKADEAVLASLSFQYGKLCHGLSASFTEEQHLWFLEFYKKLCVLGLQHENGHSDNQVYPLELESKYALVRRNCAYNFPAMVLFADPNHFLTELYPTFSSLCHDPEITVRRTMAEGFHEIVKLLGPNVHFIHKELVVLLQDDSLEVLDALLSHLQETLELATSRGEGPGPESKLIVPELVPALAAAEQKAALSLRWRVHERLLQRYACLPRVVSADQIYFRFLQRMFAIVTTNNVLPVQREAARTLCMFLRYNRKQEQRQEIIGKVLQELAQGRSYWNRLRYLDLCEIAMELFSKAYFCKHFLIQALELVNDPVANVRYKLCHMLPRLRSTIRLPADKHLLQQLEFCVRKLLCREKDKDVVATVRKTVLELDKMDITEPYHKRHERDLLDQKKEKEETLLLEMEQLERQQSEAKLTSEKHTEKKRRDSKTGLSGTKGLSGSTSGATLSTSSGKELRKAKLARSRSLSSHPTTPKMANPDKTLKVKDSGSCPGKGKNLLPMNADEALRSHHFSVAAASSVLSPTPSASSMPVLIRSNTTNTLVDHPHQHQHRSSTLDHRTTNGSKDTQSRKLSIQRKSNSFGMQSGRE
ncbi:serine/threonine-protein phosphatase 4 regulatory subunit 4 isoform 1-T3 [Salvelinus alpinus]|nr:serine/threonine-protein phosphatase 4 regulatory subunit 4 [Salvelinus alpinus]XP_023829597.1 serine/threonine-protein phosphatase 4 regulatory subunit 4 [Salvelinus alpinus]XP_029589243.1 serine/threonine-protein phosphatase 4 regulatory subunit 4 isoform X2 [Salmo trutta]XP_055728429.1 serine/threonine-protein phosphatase 4 regulatory subunit 4 isoform X1 [Salvelinus fontinalis]XP_055728431.1 serine/threonine-protein phosphatase 4 regulatory subunit 4 isoform X1 [Salvelinus fontinalis]